MRYTVLIDGKRGAYGVAFPELPGCVAMGASVEEAIANAGDSLRDWVEVTEEHGGSIPAPRPVEAVRKDPDVVEALADGALLASVPLIRETGRPVKANLSIDEGVLKAIDQEAGPRKLTRSALIEMMARGYLLS